MSRNSRVFACTPDDVFAVLADGWLFPSWVVGASRMREVADSWPQVGSRLHHSFGVWPVLIDDETEVLVFEPPRHILFRAKGWPMGEAQVDIQVRPHRDGAVVRIQEEAVAGPGSLVPPALLDVALQLRNAETLHRLAYLAEGRASRPTDETSAHDEGVSE
ncbi:SRPBCC family protein [Microbacterium sp. MM2322]|uniref:SRPBCC family protein n=1 Tax=Microbacterium sp. MM2322 TaxID=3157631 RepID=UPI0032D59086